MECKERRHFSTSPPSSFLPLVFFPPCAATFGGLHNSRKAARTDNRRTGVKNRETKAWCAPSFLCSTSFPSYSSQPPGVLRPLWSLEPTQKKGLRFWCLFCLCFYSHGYRAMVCVSKLNNLIIKSAPFWQHEQNQGLVEVHEAICGAPELRPPPEGTTPRE